MIQDEAIKEAFKDIKALEERVSSLERGQHWVRAEVLCNCGERIKNALNSEVQPSGGYDWVDEVLGLLRVARSQRDGAEAMANRLSKRVDALVIALEDAVSMFGDKREGVVTQERVEAWRAALIA